MQRPPEPDRPSPEPHPGTETRAEARIEAGTETRTGIEAPAEKAVRRIVRAALGGGDVGSAPLPDLRPVEEGGEHFSWWVGARHVLRLAPDRDATVRQRREIRLRDLVRPYVGVPVPVGVASGTWGSGLGYTLDQRLFGASGEERPVSAAGEPDLAGLLSGLRSVPVREAAALGLPHTPPRSLDRLRAEAERPARLLAADGEFDAGRLARLTPHAAGQLTPRAEAVVVHHDLKGEHLLVTDDGRVCGVLDWTDAVVGDPAEDIGGLALSVGGPAAVRAATLAGSVPRECLRGLWLARCDTVIRLAARLYGTDDSPLPLLRTQLQRAWEPILLERLGDVEPEAPDPTDD
ncbi:aminoglycoside phosphotransferase family protein [Streptomyces sp. NPDC058001]|uniref:aminoglycoside phosphotransferase family protein n=1 Tax=Streptomyces sp. NPDC058001 TaxID=3346300 RepID=UPI0036EE641F